MESREQQIALIQEIAANAWPGLVQQQLESWNLRAANGVNRRTNSVLAFGPVPSYGRWLDEVNDFYRRRNLPVRFQVSEASPAELDGMLQHLGYDMEERATV